MLKEESEFAEISKFCTNYAHKGERIPLGFGDNPFGIVFTHSAPNNLPAILYRNVFNYVPIDKSINLKRWYSVPLLTKNYKRRLERHLYGLKKNGPPEHKEHTKFNSVFAMMTI